MVPDGTTMDEEGMLWVCHWGGGFCGTVRSSGRPSAGPGGDPRIPVLVLLLWRPGYADAFHHLRSGQLPGGSPKPGRYLRCTCPIAGWKAGSTGGKAFPGKNPYKKERLRTLLFRENKSRYATLSSGGNTAPSDTHIGETSIAASSQNFQRHRKSGSRTWTAILLFSTQKRSARGRSLYSGFDHSPTIRA